MNWLSSLGHLLGHGLVSLIVIFTANLQGMTPASSALQNILRQNASTSPITVATSAPVEQIDLSPHNVPKFAISTSSSTDTMFLQKIVTYNKNADPTKTRVNNLSEINPLAQISTLLKTITAISNMKKTLQARTAVAPKTSSTTKATGTVESSTKTGALTPPSLGSSLINGIADKIQTTISQSDIGTSLPITEDVPTKIKNSLVNIYCTSKQGTTMKLVTGSGVIIDPRGVVLTDAHVAEYILVQKDFQSAGMQCFAKTGSPAILKYNVQLIYISPEWVRNNSNNLNESAPQETGESDFALVKIVPLSGSGGIFSTPFQYLSLGDTHNSNPAYTGEKIIAGSYPAEILDTESISTPLKNQTEYLSIQNSYNFSGASAGSGIQGQSGSQDLIETTPAILGQRGSSGGAITDTNGNLLGIISIIVSTSSSNLDSIRGITIDHINANLSRDTSFTLDTLKDQNIDQIQNNFMTDKAPGLESLLVSGL